MDDKWKRGFEVDWYERGRYSDIFGVEWLFDEKRSTDKALYYQAYDANLWPMRDFETWRDQKWKDINTKVALKYTEEFQGEVWLDGVKIKEAV